MTKKVAVVTAASKGMGAACAAELAQRGYDIVLMSRSDAVLELAWLKPDAFCPGYVPALPNPVSDIYLFALPGYKGRLGDALCLALKQQDKSDTCNYQTPVHRFPLSTDVLIKSYH